MSVHTTQAEQSQAQPTLPQPLPQTGAGTGPVVSAPVKPKLAVAGSPLMPRPRPSRRDHRWRAATLAIMIALLLIGGAGLLFAFSQAREQAPPSPSFVTKEFPLGSHPQIVVVNDIGTIHINRGEAGKKNASIQETIWNQNGSAPDAIRGVDYGSDGNTISIKVDRLNGLSFHSSQWIDFDITLPVDAELTLNTKTGNIAVTSINAQMHLTSETGSITVEDSKLSGISLLTTTSGSINFQGTIDAHSTASFLTNSGSITVTLPSEAAIHVDATDDLGTITVDFPGVTVTRRSAMHWEAYGNVGKPPRARVVLASKTGLITLQAG